MSKMLEQYGRALPQLKNRFGTELNEMRAMTQVRRLVIKMANNGRKSSFQSDPTMALHLLYERDTESFLSHQPEYIRGMAYRFFVARSAAEKNYHTKSVTHSEKPFRMPFDKMRKLAKELDASSSTGAAAARASVASPSAPILNTVLDPEPDRLGESDRSLQIRYLHRTSAERPHPVGTPCPTEDGDKTCLRCFYHDLLDMMPPQLYAMWVRTVSDREDPLWPRAVPFANATKDTAPGLQGIRQVIRFLDPDAEGAQFRVPVLDDWVMKNKDPNSDHHPLTANMLFVPYKCWCIHRASITDDFTPLSQCRASKGPVKKGCDDQQTYSRLMTSSGARALYNRWVPLAKDAYDRYLVWCGAWQQTVLWPPYPILDAVKNGQTLRPTDHAAFVNAMRTYYGSVCHVVAQNVEHSLSCHGDRYAAPPQAMALAKIQSFCGDVHNARPTGRPQSKASDLLPHRAYTEILFDRGTLRRRGTQRTYADSQEDLDTFLTAEMHRGPLLVRRHEDAARKGDDALNDLEKQQKKKFTAREKIAKERRTADGPSTASTDPPPPSWVGKLPRGETDTAYAKRLYQEILADLRRQAERDTDPIRMNQQQYGFVTLCVRRLVHFKAYGVPLPGGAVLLLGQGGSGKTWLINEVIKPIVAKLFGTKPGTIKAMAFKNSAAALLGDGAATIHKSLCITIMHKKVTGTFEKEAHAKRLQQEYRHCVATVVDEASMLDAILYYCLGYALIVARLPDGLTRASFTDHAHCHIPLRVTMGDMLQLPPFIKANSLVNAKQFFAQLLEPDCTLAADHAEPCESTHPIHAKDGCARFAIDHGDVIELDESRRADTSCQSGRDLRDALLCIRNGTPITGRLRKELEACRDRSFDDLPVAQAKEVMFVSTEWSDCFVHAFEWHQKLALKAGKVLYHIPVQDFIPKISANDAEDALTEAHRRFFLKKHNVNNTGNKPSGLYVWVGMRLRLTVNAASDLGLVKDTPLELLRIEFDPREKLPTGGGEVQEPWVDLEYIPRMLVLKVLRAGTLEPDDRFPDPYYAFPNDSKVNLKYPVTYNNHTVHCFWRTMFDLYYHDHRTTNGIQGYTVQGQASLVVSCGGNLAKTLAQMQRDNEGVDDPVRDDDGPEQLGTHEEYILAAYVWLSRVTRMNQLSLVDCPPVVMDIICNGLPATSKMREFMAVLDRVIIKTTQSIAAMRETHMLWPPFDDLYPPSAPVQASASAVASNTWCCISCGGPIQTPANEHRHNDCKTQYHCPVTHQTVRKVQHRSRHGKPNGQDTIWKVVVARPPSASTAPDPLWQNPRKRS